MRCMSGSSRAARARHHRPHARHPLAADPLRSAAASAAAELLDRWSQAERRVAHVDELEVPSRIVHLPLSWDDPATRLAIEKYMQSCAPTPPGARATSSSSAASTASIRIEDVQRIVFDASYLVLGLGDVYLGAPVATPLDPRHRLVTTKYNPARTWTPENAVGIGGAYLCVYGMEGPGGYQFVGRTVQMWNPYRAAPRIFATGKPWLLRFFDQIRFYPVSAAELAQMREDFPTDDSACERAGNDFRLGDYRRIPAGERRVHRAVQSAPTGGVRSGAGALERDRQPPNTSRNAPDGGARSESLDAAACPMAASLSARLSPAVSGILVVEPAARVSSRRRAGGRRGDEDGRSRSPPTNRARSSKSGAHAARPSPPARRCWSCGHR